MCTHVSYTHVMTEYIGLEPVCTHVCIHVCTRVMIEYNVCEHVRTHVYRVLALLRSVGPDRVDRLQHMCALMSVVTMVAHTCL